MARRLDAGEVDSGREDGGAGGSRWQALLPALARLGEERKAVKTQSRDLNIRAG